MSFSGTKGYITKPKPGVMLNPLHPLSRGLVGCWLFNEGSGSLANDISGNGNHGILTNMPPNIQSSGWHGSKFGGGLKFDGSALTHVETTDIFLTEFTIVAMVKPTTAAQNYTRIVDKGWDSDFFLGTDNADNKFSFSVNGSVVGDLFESNTTYSVDTWYQLIGRYDGAEIAIFIDGILDFSTPWSTNPANNTDAMRIGSRYSGSASGATFDGCIDYVQLYTRALSNSEIRQISQDPFCNLMQVPIRRYSVVAVGNPYWYYQILKRRNL